MTSRTCNVCRVDQSIERFSRAFGVCDACHPTAWVGLQEEIVVQRAADRMADELDYHGRWEYQPDAPDACPVCGFVHTAAHTDETGARTLVCKHGHRWDATTRRAR